MHNMQMTFCDFSVKASITHKSISLLSGTKLQITDIANPSTTILSTLTVGEFSSLLAPGAKVSSNPATYNLRLL